MEGRRELTTNLTKWLSLALAFVVKDHSEGPSAANVEPEGNSVSAINQSGNSSFRHCKRNCLGIRGTGASPQDKVVMSTESSLNVFILVGYYLLAMKRTRKKDLTHVGLKQYEVAALAVYVLGGAYRSIDTEDVATKCHEIAPHLFSWQKYKDQINLELVRVSLSDAKKLKNGSLLIGSGREGWRVSAKGVDWLASKDRGHVEALRTGIRQGESKAGSIEAVRRQRERDRLVGSEAWRDWNTTGSVSLRHARQVYRVDEYTTDRMLGIKIARLRAMFENDAEVSKFLEEAGRVLLTGGRDA